MALKLVSWRCSYLVESFVTFKRDFFSQWRKRLCSMFWRLAPEGKKLFRLRHLLRINTFIITLARLGLWCVHRENRTRLLKREILGNVDWHLRYELLKVRSLFLEYLLYVSFLICFVFECLRYEAKNVINKMLRSYQALNRLWTLGMFFFTFVLYW